MPDYLKVFSYEVDGLSYTVSLYEQDGLVLADITVIEGVMDVNAVYYGDDDFTGNSAALSGPLNMNGARSGGEKVQWDGAIEQSDPGLGPDADSKESFLTEGETLTVTLDVDSIDDVDVIGIRATSTSTEEGSIKGISDDPEEHEEPDDITFDKVGFGIELGDNGVISNGVYVLEENLPEGVEPTFENYVAFFEDELGGDVSTLEAVIFYDLVPGGGDGEPAEIPVELFRIEAPEGGFESAEDLIAAYDDAIEDGALDALGDEGGQNLMAALSLGDEYLSETSAPEMELEDDMDLF
jgi:hypothetical protein